MFQISFGIMGESEAHNQPYQFSLKVFHASLCVGGGGYMF